MTKELFPLSESTTKVDPVKQTLSILAETQKQLREAFRQRNLSYSEAAAWQLFSTASETVYKYNRSLELAFALGEAKPAPPARIGNSRRLIKSLAPLLEQQLNLRQELACLYLSKYPLLLESNLPQSIILAGGVLLDFDNYFDPIESNPLQPQVIEAVAKSLAYLDRVNLLLFSCPEIDAYYLTSSSSSDYIKTYANRNTGVVNAKSVLRLTRDLTTIGVNVKLNIVAGFSDEEDYIFPVLGNFGTDPQETKTRRDRYFASFKQQCQRVYSSIPELNLVNWSSLDISSPNELDVPVCMIETEADRVLQLFQPDSYYQGLAIPNRAQLRQISRLKIKTYANQGVNLKKLFPYVIGLQNETPGPFRTRMINLGLDSVGQVPFIYPFDPKTSLY